MRVATFNVLADAYTSYGDYSHVDPELMATGARLGHIVRLVEELDIDVIGLQEVEAPLRDRFERDSKWQLFWTPKTHSKPDGCLTLVKKGIEVVGFESHAYTDNSSHVMQIFRIGKTAFANTHIKWAPNDSVSHAGVIQTTELLARLGGPDDPAVIFADCNDRPGGPVRQLVRDAGFVNVTDTEPTAIVNQQLVALDLLASRGLDAARVAYDFDIAAIPNTECASDHIPLVATIEVV
ncbi:MAG: endonuclease/exonuclease/phosphatase family protein [Candidatus Saccharimonas sp.]